MTEKQRLDFEDMRLAWYLGAKRAHYEAWLVIRSGECTHDDVQALFRAAAFLRAFGDIAQELMR